MWKRLIGVMFMLLSFFAITPHILAIGDIPNFRGQIAIIGTDYNVYTIGSNATKQITTSGNSNHAFQWVTWSVDGRLAYFCCDLQSASSFDTSIFISEDGITPGREVSKTQAQPVLYAYWSPSNCLNDLSCLDLAVLYSDVKNGTLAVDLIRDTQKDISTTRIGEGSPFYFHFNATGNQLLFHRNNENLEIFSLSENKVIDLPAEMSSGTFQTASWSPVDNRILFGVSTKQSNRTDLVVFLDGVTTHLVKDIQGALSFLWSPDGTKIAYRTLTNNGYSPVIVVDATTGDEIGRSSDDAIAFFWSPDSQRIASVYLTSDQGGFSQASRQFVSTRLVQNTSTISWSIFDIASGRNRLFDAFEPTNDMVYLLNYFDQFASSHRLWSPDSQYLVYSQLVDQKSEVSILDIDGTGSSITIADGQLGVWSFN